MIEFAIDKQKIYHAFQFRMMFFACVNHEAVAVDQ